jgi:PAS domain S-box-containing protein
MKPQLRVLMVEDSEDDALLIQRELRGSGYHLDCDRVETSTAMQAALDRQPWDIVIADYSLPAFSAPEALKLLQSQQQDLPFIIVSGTIGEDTAVAAMKAGAHDYITKGNLARLVPAVERELREARERQKRNQAEQALRESEERFRQLAENITESVFWMSEPREPHLLYVSPTYERIWGRSCESVYSNFEGWLEAIHPEDRQRVQSVFFEQAICGKYDEEYRIVRPDGSLRWIRDRGFPIANDSGEPYRIVGIAEDISARKQAEERIHLQASELSRANDALQAYADELEELYNHAPCGYHTLDKDGIFIRINDTELNMLGYERDEVVGKLKFPDLLTPESVQVFQENFPFFQQRGSVRDLEFQMIRKDGTILPVSLNATAIKDLQGNYIMSRSVVIDISDRLRSEKELRDSEARYRLLFENNPNPMWVFDQETLFFLAVNQAAIAHYGYSREEFLSMTIAHIHLSDDIDPLCQTILTLTPGNNYTGVWKHLKKDGSLIDVEILAHSFSFADKQADLVLANDITARLQAEQKIHEQAALLDVATDAILVRDLEHCILFWNQGAERLYGWQAEEVLGKNAIELLYQSEETLPQFEDIQTTLIQKGRWQGEFQHIGKNNKTIIVESRWTLVRDKAGLPKSILTVSTDITAKKQLEAQFLRAQRLESLGTLASGIAHDFNNILTPIMAATQLLPLKSSNLDESSQQLLKLIEDSAKRGASLVKQILAFARGVEGKRVPLQVRHLLAEVVQVAKQTFPKAIEIYTDIPTTDLWTVSADATQLHQVFMNLCVNARDAMTDGGIFRLSAENVFVDEAYTQMNLEARVSPYVAITISDTGVGISPELLERIFDPFFTTKEPGKGTGLGLSTVLGIVKNHEGFVKVYSEVGKGSQFQVYLPASEEAAIQPVEELELLTGQGELILVVDDEPLIQEVTKTSLEERKYRTLVANDGIEAIALYAEHKHEICLVLMDIMMPSMDGLTAIRALQKLNSQVRVIATSGLISNHQLAQVTSIGVKAFLSKPYTMKELLDTIQQVLNADKS